MPAAHQPADSRSEAGKPAPSEPAFLVLGRILRPHGVRGELRLLVMTHYPERIAHLETVYIGPNAFDRAAAESFGVVGARRHRDLWLVRLEGLETREDAEPYRNQFLMVSLEDAVPLEEDEYYVFQIIGARLVTTAGEDLGQIVDVMETGANDVFVARGSVYGEVLIPDIPDVVINVDVTGQVVTVAPPPGLLPE
ncbi:MAG: 16S rRNA processing protein RimM [Anaerolineae bacterium]|nr:16S rRNA processing protein RimM [Anaerolineae bacterium]